MLSPLLIDYCRQILNQKKNVISYKFNHEIHCFFIKYTKEIKYFLSKKISNKKLYIYFDLVGH